MNRRQATACMAGLVLAALGAATNAGAHEGHEHKLMGVIERVEKDRVVVKDAEGKTLALVLTDKTVYLRGEKATTASQLQVGERVVVAYRAAGDVRTAVKVRVGAPKEK